jgi:3-oxoacyl-(acyl-carrier-protein) synthase
VQDAIVVTGAAAFTRFGGHRSGGRPTGPDGALVASVDDAALEGTPAGLDRAARLALLAAREACAQAGIGPGGRKPRLGVVLGAARSGEHARVEIMQRHIEGRRVPGSLSTAALTAGPAFAVGSEFGAGGPVFVTSGTCASSAMAVLAAAALLRSGEADVVLAGGAEACLSAPYLAQTSALRILSAGTCRPFDESRDGTWLGEGAGVLVLERASSAGSRIRARLDGWGSSFDGAMLADEEGGAALEGAVEQALARAGRKADEVDAVFAHAAGTRKGDAIEGAVLRRVLDGRPAPVSSFKSCTGHALGAAGGIELALAVEALQRGVMPPTANLERPDPALGLELPRSARELPLRAVLKTASAMGGLHAALLLSRPG